MQEIDVVPMKLDQLYALLPAERVAQFEERAAVARSLLHGGVVWNVSATAHGGGVAEMLQTLLSYVRGVGVDTRWLVLTGAPELFTVTKRVHNLLHGEPGDGGPLGPAELATVLAALADDVEDLAARVSPGDVVLLHDPQTAGMVDRLRARGVAVVWRCHVGRDTPNGLTDRAWEFLRPLLQAADGFVFSREAYAPDWCRTDRMRVIAPSIDPLSAKNRPLSAAEVQAALVHTGLVAGPNTLPDLHYVRRDGAAGTVRRHRDLVTDGGPVPAGARLVVQVSRWDRLKDMAGVLRGFVGALGTLPGDVHLVLAGPDPSYVSDDPEGAVVLQECRDLWRGLAPAERLRVHLVRLPMDSVDENAHLVNALQRRATVIVQKSLVEGFGLTVTEAMWKERPVVASAVGGLLDQIEDGRTGWLLPDPTDLAGLGATLGTVLGDPVRAAAVAAAGRASVHENYLGDRHLEAYVDLFGRLLR
ncbi:glycosyltransferase [Nocardioides panacis]|uniref:Glycosyltransferase n=1 Tax=Nocardioides panacis TaxID=2849501 RepID=A0A975SZC4_9ACTN|nr:glycosyltransferase [Nocardioides panacis]QWZ08773.1 glycosyltransferase [Nocardioides panacis]